MVPTAGTKELRWHRKRGRTAGLHRRRSSEFRRYGDGGAMWMAALRCGGQCGPGAPIYRARAWPSCRGAQEGPSGTAERNRGFAARRRKERAVSGAEEIKDFNAHDDHGDAARFARFWKVPNRCQWRLCGEKEGKRRKKKERRKMTQMRLILIQRWTTTGRIGKLSLSAAVGF